MIEEESLTITTQKTISSSPYGVQELVLFIFDPEFLFSFTSQADQEMRYLIALTPILAVCCLTRPRELDGLPGWAQACFNSSKVQQH